MLKLFRNFKYNSTYDYVKGFTDRYSQNRYFSNFVWRTLTTDYIKEGNVFIKLPFNISEVVDNEINYLSYTNPGGKEYYFFITAREYVSERVCRVIIQLDVWQTFLFDFKMERSFIERKVCNMSELENVEDGLDIGEYIIEQEVITIPKTSQFFAMFNAFREQEVRYNEGGALVEVADLNFSNADALTIIDDIQYPLYFMPLLEASEYALPTVSPIADPSIDGEVLSYARVSAKFFRVFKQTEGFIITPFHVANEPFLTAGYGITQPSHPEEFQEMVDTAWEDSISEAKASQIAYDVMIRSYANSIYHLFQDDGILPVPANHFDAFVSLCYNAGFGSIRGTDLYRKYKEDRNGEAVYNHWLSHYITGQDGEVLPGLIKRRKEEADMLRYNIYPEYHPIPVYNAPGSIMGYVEGHGYMPDLLIGKP